ncbi:unnamed protein product [Schistocephalus solidus]|uniref:Uncharacterized protein n=1 Tax=Schistocephalus solidus TaxID=70667 RepID=A0A183SBY2_SCHSO|nr:unnamed protein product [Schistocephalus solidus]
MKEEAEEEELRDSPPPPLQLGPTGCWIVITCWKPCPKLDLTLESVAGSATYLPPGEDRNSVPGGCVAVLVVVLAVAACCRKVKEGAETISSVGQFRKKVPDDPTAPPQEPCIYTCSN